MVSDTGLYHGDMKQRASESMPFSRFLHAMRMEDAESEQHWYLAQVVVVVPPFWSEHPAHSWPSDIIPISRLLQPHARSTPTSAVLLGPGSWHFLPHHGLLPALTLLLSSCRR